MLKSLDRPSFSWQQYPILNSSFTLEKNLSLEIPKPAFLQENLLNSGAWLTASHLSANNRIRKTETWKNESSHIRGLKGVQTPFNIYGDAASDCFFGPKINCECEKNEHRHIKMCFTVDPAPSASTHTLTYCKMAWVLSRWRFQPNRMQGHCSHCLALYVLIHSLN